MCAGESFLSASSFFALFFTLPAVLPALSLARASSLACYLIRRWWWSSSSRSSVFLALCIYCYYYYSMCVFQRSLFLPFCSVRMIVWKCARFCSHERMCVGLSVVECLPRSILIASLFLSFSISKLRGWSCVASAFIHLYVPPYTCAYYNKCIVLDVFYCAVCLRTTAHQHRHKRTRYTYALSHSQSLLLPFLTDFGHSSLVSIIIG